jgi:hypothetical protein
MRRRTSASYLSLADVTVLSLLQAAPRGFQVPVSMACFYCDAEYDHEFVSLVLAFEPLFVNYHKQNPGL